VKLESWEKVVRTATTVGKDIGLVGLGMWGIWHQEHTGKVELPLLIVYTVILGIPTATNVLGLLSGLRHTSTSQHTSSLSPSDSSPSLPPSGSSSSSL